MGKRTDRWRKLVFMTGFILPVAGLWLSGSCALAGNEDSLKVYMVLAAKNNLALVASYMEYQAALQKVPQAGGLPDPEFSAGFYVRPMEQMMGNQVADLRLMQMFPWFGTLRAAKDEVSKMALARLEVFENLKLNVFYQIRSSWYELYLIREEAGITSDDINVLKALETLSIIRYQAGTASPGMTPEGQVTGSGMADVLRIKMKIRDLGNRLAYLNDQETTARARFNNLLNRPSGMKVAIPDTLFPALLMQADTLFSDSLNDSHPRVRMLQEESEAYLSGEKKANRMGLPQIGLGLDYGILTKRDNVVSSHNGMDMIMPMVTVTLPIYRGKYNAAIKEAKLLMESTQASIADARNDLQLARIKAYEAYRDANRRIGLYHGQIGLAKTTVALLTNSYSTGSTSIEELLAMEMELLDYRLKLVEAVADQNTAIALMESLTVNDYEN